MEEINACCKVGMKAVVTAGMRLLSPMLGFPCLSKEEPAGRWERCQRCARTEDARGKWS